MRSALTLLTLVVLAITSFHSTSWAGPEEDRKAAEKLVGEGLALARANKFREAVPKFEAALKLYPHPEIQHNLARAHEELGELKIAFNYFSQALKQDYTYAADARTRIARIETDLRKTYARLTVRTAPSQVTVVLQFPDGVEERHVQTPFAAWAPAGRTRISGTNPNFKTGEETVDLVAGEDRELTLVLQPLPKQGFLQVSVNIAGATISMAGQPVGKSPLASIPYEAGVYQLEVRAKGYKPHVQEIVVVQDEVASVNVSLEANKVDDPPVDVPGVAPWVGWTLVGTGTAIGAAAAYIQFAKARPTQADANALENIPANDADYARLHKKAVEFETVAIVTTCVAVAVAGTGLYLLLFEAPEDPDMEARGPSFIPSFAVTPDGGAVGATLRF